MYPKFLHDTPHPNNQFQQLLLRSEPCATKHVHMHFTRVKVSVFTLPQTVLQLYRLDNDLLQPTCKNRFVRLTADRNESLHLLVFMLMGLLLAMSYHYLKHNFGIYLLFNAFICHVCAFQFSFDLNKGNVRYK